jgi:molybdopterin-guanine dinucleotide biosynthesis protein A
MTTQHAITAVILAGGRGQRMGEADKGLQLLRGKPLVRWVADSIAPQVDEVLISANRNLESYRELGFAVLPDAMPDFPGPLAGLHRALESAKHPLWLSVPCDTPFLPGDLVQCLLAGLLASNAELAVATVEGRMQPVICLGHSHLHVGLGDFLAQGGRRVGEWQAGLRRVLVPFENPEFFKNINTLDELSEVGTPSEH